MLSCKSTEDARRPGQARCRAQPPAAAQQRGARLGVAQDDEAKLGARERHIQAPRVAQEADALRARARLVTPSTPPETGAPRRARTPARPVCHFMGDAHAPGLAPRRASLKTALIPHTLTGHTGCARGAGG